MLYLMDIGAQSVGFKEDLVDPSAFRLLYCKEFTLMQSCMTVSKFAAENHTEKIREDP